MASVTATAPSTTLTDSERITRLRPVRVWLYVMAALVLAMVVVGGITRLTESGLSITSWKPIEGTLPPLSDADWQAEFEGYKQIPQYYLQNPDMTLEQFKGIFWWEWSHRFLGRFLGLAFAVPFLVFLFQRRFSWNLAVPLGGLFVLGGFQGALGWWMVSSGLTERVSVSQYRLAAHLTAAALLLVALVWVARRLIPPRSELADPGARLPGMLLLGLVLLQIAAGAFVAGMDAGMAHNTWPLMDGALVPNGLFVMQPAWLNVFENAMTVQFNHRMIAYLIVAVAAGLVVWRLRTGGFVSGHRWVALLATLVLAQVMLGIATLLSMVQIDLASAHQALAFILLGCVTAYLADLTPSRRV